MNREELIKELLQLQQELNLLFRYNVYAKLNKHTITYIVKLLLEQEIYYLLCRASEEQELKIKQNAEKQNNSITE